MSRRSLSALRERRYSATVGRRSSGARLYQNVVHRDWGYDVTVGVAQSLPKAAQLLVARELFPFPYILLSRHGRGHDVSRIADNILHCASLARELSLAQGTRRWQPRLANG